MRKITLLSSFRQSLKIFAATFVAGLVSYSVSGQVSITPASGGTGLCLNLAGDGSAPGYTVLGPISLTENNSGDFSIAPNSLIISAPAGWQFDPSSSISFIQSGSDISSVVLNSVSSSAISITITCSATASFDEVQIFGIGVEATAMSSTPQYIYPSMVSGIAGLSTGTSGSDLGDLSNGSATVPSVTIAASPIGSVCSGSGITFTPTPTNGGGTPSYEWFVNGTLVAFGTPFSTSSLSNGDVVQAQMTSSASCVTPSTASSNSITASISPLPATTTVSGGGTYCGSTTVTASNGGDGTMYFQGTTSNGTSTASAGNTQTITSSGTYYFRAQSSSGCWGTEGAVTVVINSLPTTPTVTGGGSFCVGSAILNASNGGSGTMYFEGTSAAGTSTATPATTESVSVTATYYFRAQSVAGCWSAAGSAAVTINTPPTAFAVTGGGAYCSGGSGVTVGLAGSQSGVNYQVFDGVTGLGVVAGTGSSISFGPQTGAGVYSVIATNVATTCTNSMTGSVGVTVNPLPTVYAVSGGGGYCAGGTGSLVGMANSDAGISYQLQLSGTPVGSAVVSGGGSFNFGSETTVGGYSVVATNTSTTCSANMSGTVNVFTTPLPTVYSMTGGGSYCSGGTGVHVGLSNSALGINYQLFDNGILSGSSMAGTGAPIDFGPETTAGTYTVVATDGTTSCTNNMSGTSVVVINPLPSVFDVTGGGAYCSGGTGVHVGLDGSSAGISYQLMNGGPVGSAMAGTGGALDFGPQTTVGTYTVQATNIATGCTNAMNSDAVISINPLPGAFSVTGGGAYCAGGTGVAVGLSGSASSINYQLYVGTTPTGSVVPGSGGVITFGLQTAAGTYTVNATNAVTGCSSNMTGNVTVSINPLPTVYSMALSGGGVFCSGGTGVDITLGGSQTGVNYELLRGAFLVNTMSGTGFGLDFGSQTTAGSYSVTAINTTTSCTSVMSGGGTVTTNPLPTAYAVLGGGTICSGASGVSVSLSGSSSGVQYQLMYDGFSLGPVVTGTGSGIVFGTETLAGTYTATATDPTTGCSNNMVSSAIVSVNPTPTVFAVIGGGHYCSGGTGLVVGVSGSQAGINYDLVFDGATVVGTLAGTGGVLSFPAQTAAGSYTVSATNATTGCNISMTGSASISIDPLPGLFTVTGGGSYCSGSTGVDVGLSGSASGINYELYNGSTAEGTWAGTGSSLDFGLETVAGSYTVLATDAVTACTVNMSGSAGVTVNPLPLPFTVTGGGSYCTGGTGVDVGLNNSTSGISYQLYISFAAAGSPVSGTGSPLDFGLETTGGFYTVIATNTTTGCTNNMAGGVAVITLPLPNIYPVIGGGSYCAGGTGVDVELSNSDAGVNYQLYDNGTVVGTAVAGISTTLDFGLETAAGTYTVVATDASTSCTSNMSSSAIVIINPLPLFYTVGGGGVYCSGGTGVDVDLSGSDLTINYQLMVDGSPMGSAMSGTGSLIDFGNQITAGTYTVVATNSITGCMNTMTGSVTVSIDPLPTAYSVLGGGAYCSGGTGVHVGVASSDVGYDYQLYNDGVPVGTFMTGTGSSLDFGVETVAGTYTVISTNATTSCTINMLGSAAVIVNPLPTVYTIGGGGAYCAGGSGSDITLSGSQTSVNYQLDMSGSTVGGVVAGTGSGTLDMGLQTTIGTYTAMATDAVTGCTVNMAGSVSVTTNPLPAAFAMSGGGAYCAGSTGVHVGLAGSVSGINYQLYNDGTASGSLMSGSGSSIDFGLETAAGTYTVMATDATTGCTANMTGSEVVTITPLPVVAPISGLSTACIGGFTTLTDDTTGGVWSSSNVSILTVGSTTGVVSGVAAGTASVSYTVTTSGCTTSVGLTMISLTGPTVSPIAGANNVCAGVTIDLSDATSGGAWSSSSTAIGTVNAAGVVTGLTAGSVNISYSVTDGTTGCTAVAVYGITVGNAIPASEITPASSATLCGGNPVTLSVVSSGSGFTYQWYVGSAMITGAITSSYIATTAGFYSVVLNNGTCSESLAGTNVMNAPAPFITLDTPANLLFTGSFASYQWYLDGNAIAGATDNNVAMTAPADSLYTVVVTDINGCTDTSAAFVVPGTPTSVANVTNSPAIRIYPNPVASVLHVDAPERVFVSILSEDGKVLMDHREAVSINVSELPDGLYLIMVYDADNLLIKTAKFIKQQ